MEKLAYTRDCGFFVFIFCACDNALQQKIAATVAATTGQSIAPCFSITLLCDLMQQVELG